MKRAGYGKDLRAARRRRYGVIADPVAHPRKRPTSIRMSRHVEQILRRVVRETEKTQTAVIEDALRFAYEHNQIAGAANGYGTIISYLDRIEKKIDSLPVSLLVTENEYSHKDIPPIPLKQCQGTIPGTPLMQCGLMFGHSGEHRLRGPMLSRTMPEMCTSTYREVGRDEVRCGLPAGHGGKHTTGALGPVPVREWEG